MKNDVFANIAAGGIGGKLELLEQPKPKKITEHAVELIPGGDAFAVPKKMDTKEELADALAALRDEMKPYLENHAPQIASYHDRIDLAEFTLYRDDAEPQTVTLPHYGGPTGTSEFLYDTKFALTHEQAESGKAIYVCVGGADYIASVYVNGACVGMHEGFFAPFEFEITDYVNRGLNTLRIQLKNDYIFMGTKGPDGVDREGEKLYAATGLGWDDPQVGWHHCPPGTGLYKDVYIDIRENIHLTELFVRPLPESEEAELWIEVQTNRYEVIPVEFELSVYGQNHAQTVISGQKYIPTTVKAVGLGDSFSASFDVDGTYGRGTPMPIEHGKNIYKVRIPMKDAKLWEPSAPWLYQAQVKLIADGAVVDEIASQFGMRSFTEDTEGKDGAPKGMFYLNGKSIRLRGANTMGFEQQDVLRGDIDQLIDDILLAKLCNMNFLRLTQRPVQDEIYTYCDRLGLMTQTDLPLFGKMRRTMLAEGVKQAEEMERLIRGYACNVIISYMNEPSPNAGNKPHRHMTRSEMESFFDACDIAVRMQNPDRVIKHIDGDYDPPSKTLPDNHCYPMWYNGHGIDIGMLHRGYWMNVKPGWYYGCGEFGTEGLDPADIMRECYPKDWTKEPFDPNLIVGAQTGRFYYFFYDEQDDMESWIEASQICQAEGVGMMTEAFRRDDRMITNAVHLFIDAWPSGWMKTIMDCRRTPKKAYFAYRNALEPVHLSLRTDRFTYYCGERVAIEAHICNDTHTVGEVKLRFELYSDGKLVSSGDTDAVIPENGAAYAASAVVTAPEVSDRQKYTLRAILSDGEGKVISWTEQSFEVFAHIARTEQSDNTVFLQMLTEDTEVAGEFVRVKACAMSPVHFASRKTGHSAVSEFEPFDIRWFYDAEEDMITPIVTHTFEAEGFTPILVGGNTDSEGNWQKVMIAGEKYHDGKRYVICNVDLREENPIAERLRYALLR